MTIGTNYGDYIRRTITNRKSSAPQVGAESFAASVAAQAAPEASPEPAAADVPDRWTSASLYKTDRTAPEGYTVNKAALAKVRERLLSEGEDADSRTPTHEITAEQAEWLAGRYDLDFLSACSFTHEEFGNFMLDLAYLNVFSLDEVENMYGVMPFNANHGGYLYKMDSSGGFVCENPFSVTGGAIEDKDLLAELMAEYLKARNADLSEEERERMAERLTAQRQERLSVLERFFARAAQGGEFRAEGARRAVEDSSQRLSEDFGRLV